MFRACGLILFLLGVSVGHAAAQSKSLVEPPYAIWDVELGASVETIPTLDVNDLACGTNGGPTSYALETPSEFTKCKPEPTGLREIHFSYDDELDYVARAMNSEYKVLQDGTSVFAHPVIVSILADEAAVIQGIRIVTDQTAELEYRRRAVSLLRNLVAKYKNWNLECTDLPLEEDEKRIGGHFVKQTCMGKSPDGTSVIRLDGRHLRKPGQTAVNRETRAVNATYFESFTRLEIVRLPYATSPPLVLQAE